MIEKTPISAPKKGTEHATFFYRFSIFCLLSATLIAAVLITAAMVRIAYTGDTSLSKDQKRIVIFVATLPSIVQQAFEEIADTLKKDPTALLVERKSVERPSWVRRFPASEDSGYLLFSGVDPRLKQSVVQLIRIADGKIITQWTPDWQRIFQKAGVTHGNPRRAMAYHPLLLENGDIVTHDTGHVVARLRPCQPEPVWALRQLSHHSIELDTSKAIWTVSNSKTGFEDLPWFHNLVIDNDLTLISMDGRILQETPFADVLRKNGLGPLVFATIGEDLNVDPIHINEIDVARESSPYWSRGDLLISARNLSAVFLFRPSTGTILWHQIGPWMYQHSARFVDDHRISIFDNHVLPAAPDKFLPLDRVNHVFIHDFRTGTDAEPYASLLAEAEPMTVTEGRAQVLPDGGLFVEETSLGRILRFLPDRLLWSRINDYDEKRIGLVSWSRYLTAEEARKPLEALASSLCGRPGP